MTAEPGATADCGRNEDSTFTVTRRRPVRPGRRDDVRGGIKGHRGGHKGSGLFVVVSKRPDPFMPPPYELKERLLDGVLYATCATNTGLVRFDLIQYAEPMGRPIRAGVLPICHQHGRLWVTRQPRISPIPGVRGLEHWPAAGSGHRGAVFHAPGYRWYLE
jgi:hypothetical protein